MSILQPSYMSLFLGVRYQGTEISVATGFVTNTQSGCPLLITNRHVVTGRHQETDKCLDEKTQAIPSEIVIAHNLKGRRGKWIRLTEQLYEEDKPRWHEHPRLGRQADIVALPLTQLKNAELFAYDLNTKLILQSPMPSDRLSVVGFPYGLSTGGGYAIWTTGFVASEPDTEMPNFLIDCRTKKGQSGSPVIAHSNGGVVRVQGGGVETRNEVISDFLGVYSGRKNEESDLGIVWKTSVVRELVASIK